MGAAYAAVDSYIARLKGLDITIPVRAWPRHVLLRYKNRKKQAAAKVSQGCQRRCQPVAWNLDEPVRVLQASCCYSMEWLLGGILSLGCILSLGLWLQFRWSRSWLQFRWLLEDDPACTVGVLQAGCCSWVGW